MKKLIEKIEDNAIAKYGFENKKTIIIFTITEKLRKIFF